MGPYLVFGGDPSYPNGGWADFKGQFDTVEEARRATQDIEAEGILDPWYEIVDLDILAVVEREGI
jgi:hypothetical protein